MLEAILAVASKGGCADVTVPEASMQAVRYYQGGNFLWIVQQLWGFGIPLLLLFLGWSGKLSVFAEKWGQRGGSAIVTGIAFFKRSVPMSTRLLTGVLSRVPNKRKAWFLTLAIYLILFIPLAEAFDLPLDFYVDYIREHYYGLSSQSLGRWMAQYGIGTVVTMIGAVSFVWVFYLLLKKSPRRWWFYSSIVSSGLLFLTIFVQPIWIDPLYHQFGPMENKQLEHQILHLAARAGIEDGRVFEVNMSQDTKKLNAYVVGFGRTNRIVLWDTTVEQMTSSQVLFVMGHEMGHYVLHHIWIEFLYFSALSFVVFYLTYKMANFLLGRYSKRFGFGLIQNIASFPLLLFLTSFFLFLFMPLTNAISRWMEHEADRFGLEITQDNKAAAEAFLALQQENLSNPRPGMLYKIWRGSHPSLGDRIDFCNQYCPWNHDQPLKYGKYFKKQAG